MMRSVLMGRARTGIKARVPRPGRRGWTGSRGGVVHHRTSVVHHHGGEGNLPVV